MSLESEMRVFVEVVRSGSFSKAGQKLDLSVPSVSRLFKAFEARVGSRLANRKPKFQLLPHGSTIYMPAEAAVRGMDAVLDLSAGAAPTAKVRLMVGCALQGVRDFLQVCLGEFARQHESIDVELTPVEASPEAQWRRLDVSFDSSAPPDREQWVRRMLGDEGFVFVASPSSAVGRENPISRDELLAHKFLWVGERAVSARWQLSRAQGGPAETVDVQPTLSEVDASFVLEVVSKGLGVGILPSWLVANAARKGDLGLAFYPWLVAPASNARTLQAYINPVTQRSAAVRHLVDFVGGYWAGNMDLVPRHDTS